MEHRIAGLVRAEPQAITAGDVVFSPTKRPFGGSVALSLGSMNRLLRPASQRPI